MLYDNGPLLALLAQLWLASADEAFRRAANETADWVLRDMRSPEGGFYATLDADSEGVEGHFYAWTADEVRKHLTDEEYSIVAPYYGLDEAANFEGHWHLVIRRSLASVAEAADMHASSVRNVLDSGRQALLAQRNQRVWPGRDEKILTGWNALLVRGLAIASRTLRREDLVDAADSAVEFIRDKLVDGDRLLATYKDGRAQFNGYLDDYAFLLDAILELLQVRWNSSQLEFAMWIAERLIDNFEDKEQGGFFFHPDRTRRPGLPAESAWRRCNTVWKWHRGAGAGTDRAPSRGNPLPGRSRAHSSCCLEANAGSSPRPRVIDHGPGRVPVPAGNHRDSWQRR